MEIALPKNSLTMTEAEIVAWHAAEGDHLEAGDLLYTMETAKSQVEIEAPSAGTLTQIIGQPGEVVSAGAVVAILTTDTEASAAAADPDAASSGTSLAPTRVVSPAAATLATDLGIDIDTVRGSGTAGRVIEDDVISAAQATAATPRAEPMGSDSPASRPAERRGVNGASVSKAAMSKARRAGLRLTEQMASVPTFQLAGSLDFGAVGATTIGSRTPGKGDPPTPAESPAAVSDVLMVACARALEDVPVANACLRDGEVHHYDSTRIGLLVRAGDALLPLVFPDPHRQPIDELHRRRRELMELASSGKPVPADATRWPTFVISNIGRDGVDWFSAVLYPSTAITLAVGSVSAVHDGRTATAVLTCDHRIVDGVDAAAFMSALATAVTELASRQSADDAVPGHIQGAAR